MDGLEIQDRKIAHLLCRLIPASCPFERDVSLLGHTLHIPPLCKLNPLYDEVVGLRLRALFFLSEVCGENVDCYVR